MRRARRKGVRYESRKIHEEANLGGCWMRVGPNSIRNFGVLELQSGRSGMSEPARSTQGLDRERD
jgi:hypothetical protein